MFILKQYNILYIKPKKNVKEVITDKTITNQLNIHRIIQLKTIKF